MSKPEIIFHLPGAFNFFPGIRDLGLLYQQHPHYFREGVKIGSVHGSPFCIWNGGRFTNNFMTKQHLEVVCKEMKRVNIPVRFTFTNCLLEEHHVYDAWGNTILKEFSNGCNEILCNSEILENYIRNKYGDKYQYISSTTKRFTSKNKQNEELKKDYSLVVLDYDFNKNFKYLETIENKEKCEILCNPVCKPKCSRRLEHYKAVSYCQLENTTSDFSCEECTKPFWEVQQNKNFISIDDIYNTYVPMGFNNFKLEGRNTSAFDWVEIIVYYLIKDEYHLEIRDFLQKALLGSE